MLLNDYPHQQHVEYEQDRGEVQVVDVVQCRDYVTQTELEDEVQNNVYRDDDLSSDSRNLLPEEAAQQANKDRGVERSESRVYEARDAAHVQHERGHDGGNNCYYSTEVLTDLNHAGIGCGRVEQRTVNVECVDGGCGVQYRVEGGQDRAEHYSSEEAKDRLRHNLCYQHRVSGVAGTPVHARVSQCADNARNNDAIPLHIDGETTDIVGTGGDGASTVNLSSMGAVVAAAAGVKVVKHGNRAASSKCGTADCFEALGLPMDLTPEQVSEVGNECGIAFAFARTFHPAMRFVGPIRAALGVPCVFNVLGPLTNPANPKHMAVGCANRKMSPIMAAVYAANGQIGMVYTSHEGLDEMAPTGPVSIWEFKDGKVTENKFDPTVELGLAKVTIADLKGGEPTLNAQLARDFFAGKDVSFRTTALLNAASAIVADGHLVPGDASLADRFKAAYAIAEQTVDSGKATALLDKWIATAQAAKKA